MKIDDIDRKIISLLKINSRISNVELAKEVNLTEGAVRRRIEQLLNNKIIRNFTIDVDEHEENFAVVMVKAKAETKKMMHDIISLNLVKEAYEISGDYDGCIIISAENLEAIDTKIDKIRHLKSVKDTKTFISLKKYSHFIHLI
ncbi:MAG: Lrp/AsnC family transcriptional regulator [Candidatus Micrarchaeota archaeon]